MIRVIMTEYPLLAVRMLNTLLVRQSALRGTTSPRARNYLNHGCVIHLVGVYDEIGDMLAKGGQSGIVSKIARVEKQSALLVMKRRLQRLILSDSSRNWSRRRIPARAQVGHGGYYCQKCYGFLQPQDRESPRLESTPMRL